VAIAASAVQAGVLGYTKRPVDPQRQINTELETRHHVLDLAIDDLRHYKERIRQVVSELQVGPRAVRWHVAPEGWNWASSLCANDSLFLRPAHSSILGWLWPSDLYLHQLTDPEKIHRQAIGHVPHHVQISSRLEFLELWLTSCDVTLDAGPLEAVWDTCVLGALTDDEQRQALKWLEQMATRTVAVVWLRCLRSTAIYGGER